MSRPQRSFVILACLPLAGIACSSYHYMREVTPELQTSRQEYVVNNPGNHFNDDIQVGRVRKGMSRLQVRITWGEPDQVDPQVGREVWSYQELEPSRGTCVYNLHFAGELLTSVDMDRSANELPATVENPTAKDEKQKTEVPATGLSTGKKPIGTFN